MPQEPLTPEMAVGRRRVITTAAWAIPTIAVATAAPMSAASCTDATGIVNWSSGYTRQSGFSGSGSTQATDGFVTPYAVSGTFGPLVGAATSSLTVGGTTGQGAGLFMTSYVPVTDLAEGQNDANNSAVTVVFDTPVWDLTFTIWDIDRENRTGQAIFSEWVRVPTPGVVTTLGSNLEVVGGWIRNQLIGNRPNNEAASAATFSVPGPTSTITMEMSRTGQQTPASAGGGVIISNLSYRLPCPTPL